MSLDFSSTKKQIIVKISAHVQKVSTYFYKPPKNVYLVTQSLYMRIDHKNVSLKKSADILIRNPRRQFLAGAGSVRFLQLQHIHVEKRSDQSDGESS